MKVVGIVLIVFLTGCGTLDMLSGVNPDGSVNPGGGPAGAAGDFLGGLGGWGAVAGGIVGVLGSAYGAIRSRRYGQVARSVVAGVHKVRQLKGTNGRITVSEENLLEILRTVQDSAGTRKDVDRIISRLENDEPIT
jgi:hypothetical protein